MGCGCGSKTRSAAKAGKKVTGYKVELEDGTTTTYLTDLEAKRAARQAGGARVTMITE